ncbi:MAG: hypothetical protein KGQ82_10260, partial [Alphaproteobacteria bacterium]|nr:hypothetical protein [Alphaproteobacteria bacterium]
HVVLALAAVTLAGCTHDWEYAQPVGLTPQTAATLTGSKISNPGFLKDDPRAYLVGIDGKLTNDGALGWDDRHLASPGMHSIRFAIAMGVGGASGFGDVSLELQAGRTYTIRSTVPVVTTRDELRAEGWIEDDNGKAVTNHIVVTLHVARGGEMIPIIIPK